jgi:predicted SprT family Zn-dependent metalloprotease
MREFVSRIEGMLRGKHSSPSARMNSRRGVGRKRDPGLEQKARIALRDLDPELAGLVSAGWNARMRTTAGVAVLARNEIWLNPALLEVSAEEVERTLLHELAHLLARRRHPNRLIAPHGPEWAEACRDLGIPGESRTHRLPFQSRRLERRFILRCPVCGRHHERVRRPRRPLACLHCCRLHNRGLYDARFRLQILVKGDAEPAEGSP